MNIYRVGNNLMALSQKQVENLINKRDNYDINEAKVVEELAHGNVLDIGANIGYFTVIMAKSEKVNKVFAFEPDPDNYDNLVMNLGINKVLTGDKITPLDRAITNNNGYTKLYKCKENDGMHRIYKSKWCPSGEYINVETNRIDDCSFITKHKIDFIKLDIEGSELGALKGMEQMLKKDHPTIVMEFHPPSIEEAGDKPKDIYDLLENAGYTEFGLLCYGPSYHDLTYDEIYTYTKNTAAINLVCK